MRAGNTEGSELFRVSPHIPILVWSRLRDEDAARLALQRGAQDYAIQGRGRVTRIDNT